jgi:hypothetical protein
MAVHATVERYCSHASGYVSLQRITYCFSTLHVVFPSWQRFYLLTPADPIAWQNDDTRASFGNFIWSFLISHSRVTSISQHRNATTKKAPRISHKRSPSQPPYFICQVRQVISSIKTYQAIGFELLSARSLRQQGFFRGAIGCPAPPKKATITRPLVSGDRFSCFLQQQCRCRHV